MEQALTKDSSNVHQLTRLLLPYQPLARRDSTELPDWPLFHSWYI
jgi:hypothetical protein